MTLWPGEHHMLELHGLLEHGIGLKSIMMEQMSKEESGILVGHRVPLILGQQAVVQVTLLLMEEAWEKLLLLMMFLLEDA
jgi:hypothetical protein